MSPGFRKHWLLLLPITVLAIAVAFGLSGGAQPAFAQTDVMSIDGDPSTAGIQATTPLTAVTANATVAVNIESVSQAYTTYMWEASFDATELDYVTGSGVHNGADPLGTCFGFTEGTFAIGPLTGDDFVNTSCGVAPGDPATSYTGPVDSFAVKCMKAGNWPLHLVSTVEDPVSGTIIIGNPAPTLNDVTVQCELQSDWNVVKTDDGTRLAGGTVTYTAVLTNGGPNATSGLVVADLMPQEKVVVGTPGVSALCKATPNALNCPALVPAPGGVTAVPAGTCAWFEGFNGAPFGFPFITNLVLCDYSGAILGGPVVPIPNAGVVTVTITAGIPLNDAGKYNFNAILPGDITNRDPNGADEMPDCAPAPIPTPNDSIGCEVTIVSPASMTITKTADMSQYSQGDTIIWAVSATSNGPSPASNVVLSDTVDANETLVSATLTGSTAANYNCDETSSNSAAIAPPTATCTLEPQAGGDPVTTPVAVGVTATMQVVATVVGSANNLCVNNASVNYADPLPAPPPVTVQATVPCFPPTVRMEKDADTDPLDIDDEANLWICDGPTCDENGEGSLTIYERVVNVGNDPDGAGAYEFQVKFDHKLFDIVVEDSSWLSNEGARDVDCSMEIITENWILFGCVSSGPVPGQTANGVMATLTVTPESDMRYRLTPGQDNGVYDEILDENCEIADVLGDPLMLQDEDGNDIGLAPGIVTGGLVEICSDIGVTIRILEGDLNLDCEVDVLDQQMIAFRYGSIFGMLLYDDWFDLQPNIKDFDVDIKDLQKVWGRDGSTCGGIAGVGTIPPQPPMPFPW